LHDKPLDFLTFVIMRGRPGTAMPPWSRFLSDSEALWIADQLQKGFPNEQ
jgi:cytochrome c55X